jgi:Holliday junction DNA helicase RuvB
MARERIVTANEAPEFDDQAGNALRPQRLEDYIGQRELVERLRIALEAVRERGEPMEHVLLHGPPGLGKTTLAHIIASEMGSRAYVTSGPALTKASDLVGMLTKLSAKDVLFIDEIHRLPAAVEEYIYPAMEDFKVDFTVDSGMHAKVVTLRLKPFTLIGATTRAGLLTQPLRSRFGIAHHLEFYEQPDLVSILVRAARHLSMRNASGEIFDAVAARARGTPRVALRLLRRVRDFAQVRAEGKLVAATVDAAMRLESVDTLGLDDLDRKYLRTIRDVYEGGPVGLDAIAATMGDDSDTLEDLVEPYLLRMGFVARTRQGRKLTTSGAELSGVGVSQPSTSSVRSSSVSKSACASLGFARGAAVVGRDARSRAMSASSHSGSRRRRRQVTASSGSARPANVIETAMPTSRPSARKVGPPESPGMYGPLISTRVTGGRPPCVGS